MVLFQLDIAKTLQGQTARESPEAGFIDEVHGQEACMASQRHFARIQAPGACPMAHCSFALSTLMYGAKTGSHSGWF